VRGGASRFHFIKSSEFEGLASDSLPATRLRAGFASILRLLRAPPVERQAGQSIIEFAFTLVIILILLVGVIDLGRAIFTYLALRDAAQEGASYLIYDFNNNFPTVSDRVCGASNMVSSLCNSPGVNIDIDPPGFLCSGDGVRVSVTTTNTLVTPFLGALVGQSFRITASVSDTVLVPPCP
jgi:hypothetical protein